MAFEFLFGRAVIRFEAQDQALRRATRRIGQDVRRTTGRIGEALGRGLAGAAQTATTAFGRMGQAVSRVLPGLPPQALAAAAAIGAIVIALRSVTKAASEFEAAFAEVRTLIDESKVATAEIEAALLKLPPILGTSTELTKALYQAISAGAEPAAAIDLVRQSALLARAGLTSTFKAVDVLTTILNAYGLEAVEASRISDVLFKAVEQGKTTVDALASSLGQVIPFAATLGINIEDLTAAVATLTKGGLATDKAITALRGVFGNFIQEADRFREAGIDINEVLAERGLQGVLEELRRVTGGNIEALREFIPDVRALGAAAALTGVQFDEFTEILEKQQQAQGATRTAFEKQADTFKARSAEFSAAFERLRIAVGVNLLPLFKEFFRQLTIITIAIPILTARVREFVESSFIIKTLVGAFKALFQPISLITGAVANAADSVLDFQSVLAEAQKQTEDLFKETAAKQVETTKEGAGKITDTLLKEQEARNKKIAAEQKRFQEATLRGEEGAVLRSLLFERQVAIERSQARTKVLEIEKKIKAEQVRLEEILAQRRSLLGGETAQEEIDRLREIASETSRTAAQRLQAEADLINKTKALREEQRNVALKAIRAVRKGLEERGITEATQAEIQAELARQSAAAQEKAGQAGADLAGNIRVNLKDLESTISGFGESQDLQRALERVGGFGEAATGALTPDTETIISSTQDIANAYDEALTQVENRIDQFGQRAEQKILKVTERIVGGVRTFIDERLARQLEFEGTRR